MIHVSLLQKIFYDVIVRSNNNTVNDMIAPMNRQIKDLDNVVCVTGQSWISLLV